jgi:hypothetical protein
MDEIVGAVPSLDGVEAFVDLTAQHMAVHVAGKEDRPDGAAPAKWRLVTRMLVLGPLCTCIMTFADRTIIKLLRFDRRPRLLAELWHSRAPVVVGCH